MVKALSFFIAIFIFASCGGDSNKKNVVDIYKLQEEKKSPSVTEKKVDKVIQKIVVKAPEETTLLVNNKEVAKVAKSGRLDYNLIVNKDDINKTMNIWLKSPKGKITNKVALSLNPNSYYNLITLIAPKEKKVTSPKTHPSKPIAKAVVKKEKPLKIKPTIPTQEKAIAKPKQVAKPQKPLIKPQPLLSKEKPLSKEKKIVKKEKPIIKKEKIVKKEVKKDSSSIKKEKVAKKDIKRNKPVIKKEKIVKKEIVKKDIKKAPKKEVKKKKIVKKEEKNTILTQLSKALHASSKETTSKKSKTTTQKTQKKAPIKIDKRKYQKYVIEKGDSLLRLAINHKTSIKEIMRINSLKKPAIRIGQEIYLPKVAKSNKPNPAKKIVKSSKKENKTKAKYKIYTIQKGDSLEKIAKKYKTSIKTLKELNSIESKNIIVGKKIKIPL